GGKQPDSLATFACRHDAFGSDEHGAISGKNSWMRTAAFPVSEYSNTRTTRARPRTLRRRNTTWDLTRRSVDPGPADHRTAFVDKIVGGRQDGLVLHAWHNKRFRSTGARRVVIIDLHWGHRAARRKVETYDGSMRERYLAVAHNCCTFDAHRGSELK